jgi:hypothetical protein
VSRKAVHLAAKLGSFKSARDSLAETVEVELTTKRIERLAGRIGGERVEQRELNIREWEALPLMQKLAAPPGVKPSAAACVMYDGGRMQRCDLPDDAKTHWCETKVGVLLEFQPRKSAQDPCPELPDSRRLCSPVFPCRLFGARNARTRSYTPVSIVTPAASAIDSASFRQNL